MRALIILALFALLALAVWFAGSTFVHFGGEAIPLYGYIAIAGGALFSLLIGCGLMALVFYSNRCSTQTATAMTTTSHRTQKNSMRMNR